MINKSVEFRARNSFDYHPRHQKCPYEVLRPGYANEIGVHTKYVYETQSCGLGAYKFDQYNSLV